MTKPTRLAPLVEWRCPHCRNLLLKVRLVPGTWIQVKCPKCRKIVERGGTIQQAA